MDIDVLQNFGPVLHSLNDQEKPISRAMNSEADFLTPCGCRIVSILQAERDEVLTNFDYYLTPMHRQYQDGVMTQYGTFFAVPG